MAIDPVRLVNPSDPSFPQSWANLFFNVEQVRLLIAESDPSLLTEILSAGLSCDGVGWNTAKATARLYELTRVTLVIDTLQVYLLSFLFSVALAGGVEVPSLKLPEKSADAAMGLYELWTRGGAARGTEFSEAKVKKRAANETSAMEEDGAEPGAEQRLPWEEAEEDLPEDLAQLWARAQEGTKKLDVKRLLQDIPVFRQLPARPPENNHRGDGKGQHDKALRVFQTTTSHLLRIYALIHSVIREVDTTGEMLSISQQAWLLMAEQWNKMSDQKKAWSIPGSVQPEHNVLFKKEDLAIKGVQEKIDKASRWKSTARSWSSFRPYYGRSSYSYGKGKGKGAFRGYGSQSFRANGGKSFGKGQANGWPDSCGTVPHSLQEAAVNAPLVETACTSFSLPDDCGRDNATLDSGSNLFCAVSEKKSGGDCSGEGDPSKIPGSGSSAPSAMAGNKASGTLVRHCQTRKGVPKVAPHFRLSRIKFLFHHRNLQTRQHPKYIPLFEKGMVGSKGGPAGCLLSHTSLCPAQTLPQNASGGHHLGI